jgi:hypothetical protein
MQTYELDNTADIIDVRDIIERIEDLENSERDMDEQRELNTLLLLMDDLKGNGLGAVKWCGDWYPVTLIRDDYFVDYAEELVLDICSMPNGMPLCVQIDWDATARNIRMDYTSTEIDGVTYWYR